MTVSTLITQLEILQKHYPHWDAPVITLMSQEKGDPFLILIATILSLRTKDETTALAKDRLFAEADTPETLLALPVERISHLIYPVGFYKTKAQRIHEICRILLSDHQGRVPADMEALLALPGVGRKTANLVLGLGFGIPSVCVDVHVHRISNRFGLLATKTPDETEMALREILPQQWWIPYNDLLVAFGQTLCKPVSPWCSRCPVSEACEKRGVTKAR